MSITTDKLEAAVAAVIADKPAEGERGTARQRANVDRAFAAILKLIAPRIRHFIRQYGLHDHWDDAEQVCAIAVHNAIAAYDPEKAKFTTFINWQLRGELQGLRFRLMTDQRPSAKKVDATTISLHATTIGGEGEETTLEAIIEDEDALGFAEAGAGAYFAKAASAALLDAYIDQERDAAVKLLKKRAKPSGALRSERPDLPIGFRSHLSIDAGELARLEDRLQRDRAIIERCMFEQDSQYQLSADTGLTRERVRQITRRASKAMVLLAQTDPRFALLADLAPTAAPQPTLRTARDPRTATLLPAPGQAHNAAITVVDPLAAQRNPSARPAQVPAHNIPGPRAQAAA